MLKQFVKDCLPWVGTHARGGEEHEEEGAAEKMCDELTATPVPHASATMEEGGREFRNELEPRMMGDVEESCGLGLF